MALYCTVIWFALDLGYSLLVYQREPTGRVPHPYYHHGWMANFAGTEPWGPTRVPMFTNSLGFRDAKVRDVPAAPESGRRVVLIGDSVVEGVGLKFEDTFAGLLARAGQERPDKIEFLNAGAVSYSPVIYYKKIKYLLDAGLQFDHVVVFSDISDVHDESKDYFCIDDDPAMRRHCNEPAPPPSPAPTLAPKGAGRPEPWVRSRLKDYFVITDRMLQEVRHGISDRSGEAKAFQTRFYQRAAWTSPGFDMGNYYDPLGVQGGVDRSLANMAALSDLLRARSIGLTVVVYPWPFQLAQNDRDSRQVRIWRDFCATRCTQFIDLFPAVFAVKDTRADWYEHLFIAGDSHYSVAGNRLLYRAVADALL